MIHVWWYTGLTRVTTRHDDDIISNDKGGGKYWYDGTGHRSVDQSILTITYTGTTLTWGDNSLTPKRFSFHHPKDIIDCYVCVCVWYVWTGLGAGGLWKKINECMMMHVQRYVGLKKSNKKTWWWYHIQRQRGWEVLILERRTRECGSIHPHVILSFVYKIQSIIYLLLISHKIVGISMFGIARDCFFCV